MQRAEDLFAEILESQVFWFPCAAEVVRFDAATQTADIRPAVTLGGTAAPEVKGALVLLPAGAGWEIDFHLQAGDQVLAVFASHIVAHWRTGAPVGKELQQPRLSDAVVLPGLARSSRAASISGGVALRNTAGTVELKLTNGGVEVTGNLTVTGDITAGAISPATEVSLLTHQHSGVTAGSGSSGAPVPGT